MRFLAASDLHGNHRLYRSLPVLARQHGVAAIALAGDLLGSGADGMPQEEAQRREAEVIVDILSSYDGPIFYIMGNDDSVELEVDRPSFQSIHRKRVDLGPYNFVGYQFTLPFAGGPFERREQEIAADLRELAPLIDGRTVLVTHSPAYGVLDQTRLGAAGSRSLANLIATRKPRLHLHGHIHECFGRSGIHFNVAAGRTMRAMVIDLESLEHRVIRPKRIPNPESRIPHR